MSSSKEDMSQFAAELYAIVAVSTCDSPVQLSSRIAELTADSRNQVSACNTASSQVADCLTLLVSY
jgi:hypothetical protein